MNKFDALKAKLLEEKAPEHLPFDKGLSSGSTLINLACTSRPDVAFLPGRYFHFVGDSSSGKTFLCLTVFAEACINPVFKDYRLIFDNAEDGALMNLTKFFGPMLGDRLEPPAGSRKKPKYSDTVEGLFRNADRALDDGAPFIYILDSTDTLSTSKEVKEHKAAKKLVDGDEEKGTYGTSRAKEFSNKMRMLHNRLRDDGRSMVFLITQTRSNIGFGAKFEPKTYSGGNSFIFYAAMQIWFSQAGHIKKTVKGKPRELGIYSKVRLKKNRVTGRDRSVVVPILHSFGLDDLGGCLNYLIDEGHWKGKDSSVAAPEFDFDGNKEKLIRIIEEAGREGELRELTAKVWNEIESACEVKRKSRYG